jgi:nitrate reductase gamma subunit
MTGPKTRRIPLVLLLTLAVLLFGVGLGGGLVSAWGYGLFLFATVLILAGLGVFALFLFSRRFDGDALRGTFAWLFRLGGWAYVLAVAALAGFFVDETLRGRMEARWILFGPAALIALMLLDWGLYRLLVGKNLPTWNRYGHLVARETIDAEALRRTLIDDVVLHRTLLSVSGLRWLRHTLIFWGFTAMFGLEMIAVFLREAVPAFGWRDIWREPGHPVRLAFDAGFDLTGLMMLVGCLLALGWRIAVNGTPERKYADTPTTAFLLFVVVTGFAVEGIRLAPLPPGPEVTAAFVGAWFAAVSPKALTESAALAEALWLTHTLASCAFIAYVPAKRLVHSCATPIGRLMNSQKTLLAAKKRASLQGILIGKPLITPAIAERLAADRDDVSPKSL